MIDAPNLAVDAVGNNLDSVTPVPPPIEAAPRFSDVLRAGLTTGVTASLLCWLLYGIATLFGTDFDVALGDSGSVHVAWYGVLVVPLLAALAFALIATALRKRRNCGRRTRVLGYLLGGLSLAPVLLQSAEVSWATRIWLVILHIVVILLVVPQVARIVGDSDPYVTGGHRRIGLEAG